MIKYNVDFLVFWEIRSPLCREMNELGIGSTEMVLDEPNYDNDFYWYFFIS